MSVEFSAIKETPPTCIPKGYTREAKEREGVRNLFFKL